MKTVRGSHQWGWRGRLGDQGWMEGRGKADLRDSYSSGDRVKVEKFKKGNMVRRTCGDVQVRTVV